MGNHRLFWIVSACLIGVVAAAAAVSQEIEKEDCFFLNSLHYTANGMGYWYAKENGGLEGLTGIPYERLGCKNCHTPGCDRCHKSETVEKDCRVAAYSTRAASNQAMCLKCHGREGAMIRIDHKAGQEDVHLLQGMVCVDCHSEREMHGDGRAYQSLKSPGAMDTRCESCHDDIKPIESHQAHGGRLDCKACHLRHVVSCTNCHFDTMVEKGVRKAIPVSGWLFLMNYRGKVSSASMQTFVTGGDKTFLLFAPHMSHSVMNPGRSCDACHATENVTKAVEGEVALTWLEAGKVVNRKGVIPVVDGVDYRCSYQNFGEKGWVPVEDPRPPVIQYAAFGSPLTREQLEMMAEVQESPPPKME